MKLSYPLEVICMIGKQPNGSVVITYYRKCEVDRVVELKRNDDSSISIRQIGGNGPIVLGENSLVYALKMLS